MQRIALITVGKIKTSWIKEGCDLYADRLKEFAKMDLRIIEAGDPKMEQQKIMKAMEGSESIIVALDETGKDHSSIEFSKLIGTQRDAGRPITFVIGGAYGLSDEIRSSADIVLRLSSMTFPHELCQLIFLEQLYRAFSILKGSGYHH